MGRSKTNMLVLATSFIMGIVIGGAFLNHALGRARVTVPRGSQAAVDTYQRNTETELQSREGKETPHEYDTQKQEPPLTKVATASPQDARHTAIVTPPYDTSNIYSLRKQHANEFCNNNRINIKPNTSVNAVIDKLRIVWSHRWVYCAMEKIGSTYWNGILQRSMRIKGNHEIPVDVKPELLYQYSKGSDVDFNQLHWALTNFTTFMFVRNPYARVLSGFVDKILVPNTLFRGIGRLAVEKFRPNATMKAKQCGFDVTFPEFIQYVVHSAVTGEKRNGHFIPMFDHCRPCEYTYDIIGKMETFENDTKYIMTSRGLETLLPQGDFVDASEKHDIIDMIGWLMHFSRNDDVMPCMSYRDIKLRYWRKMQIKGLISIEIDIPETLLNNNTSSRDDYTNAAFSARENSGDYKTRILNRKVAMRQAFQSVAKKDLDAFKKVFEPDFKIFGYDENDASIFQLEWEKSQGDFFNVPFL